MHPFLDDVKNLLLDTLFPIECLGCEAEGLFLCPGCQTTVRRLSYQQCVVCRMPSAFGFTHQRCAKETYPAGLISALDYHDPLVAQAIIWGKYKFLPETYRILARLLAGYIEQYNYQKLFTDVMLCPIPLAKTRLRWRGFNQSMVIADVLSKHFSVPIIELLSRVKSTKTQKDLTKTERAHNVADAFQITKLPANSVLSPDTGIILIDDVITSGATLLAAATELRKHFPNEVFLLTLARD